MEEMHERGSSTAPAWSLIVLGLVLCFTVALGGFFLVREHKQTEDLAANNLKLTSALSQVQSQLAAVSDKLNALATAPAPAPGAHSGRSSIPDA